MRTSRGADHDADLAELVRAGCARRCASGSSGGVREKDDAELVAPQPADLIRGPGAGAQRFGDRAQRRHRRRPRGRRLSLTCLKLSMSSVSTAARSPWRRTCASVCLERLLEAAPVEQPGEHVVAGEMLELGLRLVAVRDVEQLQGHDRAVPRRRGTGQHVAHAAVQACDARLPGEVGVRDLRQRAPEHLGVLAADDRAERRVDLDEGEGAVLVGGCESAIPIGACSNAARKRASAARAASCRRAARTAAAVRSASVPSTSSSSARRVRP